MKITLLEVYSKESNIIYKDFAGGLGPGFSVGKSIFSKAIEFAKKKGINLPIVTFGYLNSILSKNGHQVERMVNEVPDSDLVLIHSSLCDYKLEIEMAKSIKQKTKARVGFIGPLSSYQPDLFLESADFIIKGEPEYVADRLSKDWPPDGIVESNDIENLDELPFPNWDFFPVNKTSYYPSLSVSPVLPVLSSRGCAHKCNYCPYLILYKNWRVRSEENVLNEIEYLVERYNIKGFVFRDPTFTLPMERAQKIGEGLIKKKFQLKWACETRLDYLTIPLIDILYDSGLRVINVGIETANEEILKKSSRKFINIEHQEKIISYCDKKGINITAFYILGWPNDTMETMQQTLRYAKKLNTNVAGFTIYTPFPGTEAFEQFSDKFTTDDFSKFDAHHLIYKHDRFSADELYRIKEKAFLSYYYRPKYFIKFLQRKLRR